MSDTPKFKINPVCMVRIQRLINWSTYDDECVTVKQDKELRKMETFSPTIKFFPAATLHKELDAYLKVLKESIESNLHQYIRIAVSTPSSTTETTQGQLNEIFFYGTEYIGLDEI